MLTLWETVELNSKGEGILGNNFKNSCWNVSDKFQYG